MLMNIIEGIITTKESSKTSKILILMKNPMMRWKKNGPLAMMNDDEALLAEEHDNFLPMKRKRTENNQ